MPDYVCYIAVYVFLSIWFLCFYTEYYESSVKKVFEEMPIIYMIPIMIFFSPLFIIQYSIKAIIKITYVFCNFLAKAKNIFSLRFFKITVKDLKKKG